MNWLNTPCTDPSGRVFEKGGRYYRAIYRSREAYVRELFAKGIVQRLAERGLLAPTRIADEERVDGCGLVLETEAAPFAVPCDRFSRRALLAAALGWLDAALELQGSGCWLSDAHFGNTMLFWANRPLIVDLGSIREAERIAADRPFPSFTRFCVNMAAPVLALFRQPALARAARLAIGDHPYNGPLFPAHDGPFELRSVSAPHAVSAIAREAGMAEARDAEDALLRLRAFLAALPGDCGAAQESALRGLQGERALFGCAIGSAAQGVSSAVCVGADAYLSQRESLRGTAVLVVEEREVALDALDLALADGAAAERVSAYYGTLMNRQFPSARLRGDRVLAADPFVRLRHDSQVMYENIAFALAALARREALVSVHERDLAPARAALGQVFAAVCEVGAASGAGPGDRVALLRCGVQG